jgi:hypothetical protein
MVCYVISHIMLIDMGMHEFLEEILIGENGNES